VELSADGDEVVAAVKVANSAAGHAVPTGEPLRQLILHVEAEFGGVPVAASGGRAVPDVGGWLAQGTVGEDLQVTGDVVAFSAPVPVRDDLVVRFVRPTGQWDDYDGPGTAWFSDLSAEDKGLPTTEVLGEVAVAGIDGAVATLTGPPPALQDGDIAWLGTSDLLAGAPGWLFAKVLVDQDGNRGVAHYRATDIASDNRIAQGGSAAIEVRFPATQGLEVTTTLLYREYGAPVALTYGWDPGDHAPTTVHQTWSP